MIQQGDDDEEVSTLKKCIRGGDVAVFYDATYYDSCLEHVLTRKVTKKDGKLFMRVRNEDVPFHESFQLYMICRGAQGIPEYQLQTRCTVIDFNFTNECMTDYFMDIVFECEMPAKRQEYLLICDREIEAINVSKKCREKIAKLFNETETNILDNIAVINSTFETLKELNKSDDRASVMRGLKMELRTLMQNYLPAAVHATTLYLTVKQLKFVNIMYEYEFEWFVKVFKLSIENSNKSKIIEKRLRYLKDHLTYSLFCQVSNSLWQEHRMVFAFLLCCRLLIGEGRLDDSSMEQLAVFLRYYKDKPTPSPTQKPKPDLYWLKETSWPFFLQYEALFDELKGLTDDMVENQGRWQMLCDAKEPDNLPLHEPWYSRLSRFHKLVIVGALRPDKLMELAFTFVSDHVGYKFVEPVQLDLGRVFSECEPSQPLLFVVKGANEASKDVRTFASDRSKKLASLTMWDVKVSSLYTYIAITFMFVLLFPEKKEDKADSLFSECRSTGKQWLFMENFDLTSDKSSLLRHHSILGQDFHNNYRLWLISREVHHVSGKKAISYALFRMNATYISLIISLTLRNYDYTLQHFM